MNSETLSMHCNDDYDGPHYLFYTDMFCDKCTSDCYISAEVPIYTMSKGNIVTILRVKHFTFNRGEMQRRNYTIKEVCGDPHKLTITTNDIDCNFTIHINNNREPVTIQFHDNNYLLPIIRYK